MKSFASLVMFVVVAAGATTLVEAAKNNNKGTQVDIRMKCSGLDLDNLDYISTMILAQVLEESYAKVVNDQSDSSMKVEVGNWRCGRLCPDDDAVEEQVESTVDGFALKGYWNCGRNCPQDEKMMTDLVFGAGGLRGAKKRSWIIDMSSWEKTFVDAMIGTGRSKFRSIHECSIDVNPSMSMAQSS